MPASAPTDADVQAFVTSYGIPVPSGFTYTGIAAKALAFWETMTGWSPFLAGSSSSRKYNPPGGRVSGITYGGGRFINFGAGLATFSSLTVYGQTKTKDVDFQLLPLNATERGMPFTRVEFFVEFYAPAASVVITGQWGYSTTFPDDAWEAVLRIAAGMIVDGLKETLSLSNGKTKVDDLEVNLTDLSRAGEEFKRFAKTLSVQYSNNCVGL